MIASLACANLRFYFAETFPMIIPNDPPYRHWHVVCRQCALVTLALATHPPAAIDLLRENPVVKCGSCASAAGSITGLSQNGCLAGLGI
jgi:hypothetical protein